MGVKSSWNEWRETHGKSEPQRECWMVRMLVALRLNREMECNGGQRQIWHCSASSLLQERFEGSLGRIREILSSLINLGRLILQRFIVEWFCRPSQDSQMAMKNWPPGWRFCCLFDVCQMIFWLTAFVVTEARDDGLGRRNRWRAWGCSFGLVDLVCFESANCKIEASC